MSEQSTYLDPARHGRYDNKGSAKPSGAVWRIYHRVSGRGIGWCCSWCHKPVDRDQTQCECGVVLDWKARSK